MQDTFAKNLSKDTGYDQEFPDFQESHRATRTAYATAYYWLINVRFLPTLF
jgi:hypothetical protein